MRLIDTDKLKFPNIAIFDMKLHGATVPMVRLIDLQMLMPTVDAVPLDKLCEWLSENRMNIPCVSCQHFANQYCTAIGDMSKPCPNTKDDWREAITKWMEGLDAEIH